MTVIAIKDGVMAADSHNYCNGSSYPSGFPKITRGPLGLIGLAGESNDCYLVSRWWADGAVQDQMQIPRGLRTGDQSIVGLILKDDGSASMIDERLQPFPVRSPVAAGNSYAQTFCEGAMHAGLSAEDAVWLTIKHCVAAGGDVQVERLEIPERIFPLPPLRPLIP